MPRLLTCLYPVLASNAQQGGIEHADKHEGISVLVLFLYR